MDLTRRPETDQWLDIGAVIAASGVPASTLHVWERHGLITPVARIGLRRQFHHHVVDRIAVIVVAQRSGFSLAEIAELLSPDAFADGKHVLEDKLNELRRRREDLDAAIAGLTHALACTTPSPLDCSDFRSALAEVLPVDRPSSSRP